MSKLYIVATPIGNLGDVTYRAVEALSSCDVIACEDTRHTPALLNRFGIKKPLISYYKQKEREGSVEIAELVESGKNVALVSDAGMPCISDPGNVVVREFIKRGLEYTVIPGANAALCAVALTGTEAPFTFLGFLPEKEKDRGALLARHADSGASLIIYAAPHDVNKILDCLHSALGDREVWLVKEISKIYERVSHGTLSSLREENPKGEFVVIVNPAPRAERSDEEIIAALKRRLDGGVDRKTASSEVALSLNVSKNRVYKLSVKLQSDLKEE